MSCWIDLEISFFHFVSEEIELGGRPPVSLNQQTAKALFQQYGLSPQALRTFLWGQRPATATSRIAYNESGVVRTFGR